MFVTSAQRMTMSGQQQIPDVERQNLLDRLLDAVKQCQVRFGGKTELATDGDSRVTCLLTQFEAVLQHGLKRSRSRISAFRQVGQATGIVKLPPDSVFWSFVKEHLSKLDVERFLSLEKATTDAGRGRAWLRSALNEHSLERYIHYMLQNKLLLSQFYDKDAFMMDEERASMLPMMAAGLSSILFALTVDCEDLNIVRQVPATTLNREVFSNILPSFPQKPVEEPLAVYSSVLSSTEDTREDKRKKKKKKKRVQAAIVAIEEDENSLASQKDASKHLPLNDSSVKESEKTHTRSSSYPGNITVNPEDYPGKTALIDGKEVLFTEISKSISLPDNSVAEIEVDKNETERRELDIERFEETLTGPTYDAGGAGREEVLITGERRNFVFGAVDLFQREAKLRENENGTVPKSPFTEHREANSLNTQTEITSKAVGSDMMDRKNDDSLKTENTTGSQSFTGTTSIPSAEKVSAATEKPSLNTNNSEDSFSENFSKLNVFSVNDIANNAKFNDDHSFQVMGNIYSHKTTNEQKDDEDQELDTEGELNRDLDEQMSSPELQEMTHEPVVLLDSGESLVPVMEGEIAAVDRTQSTFDESSDFLAEKDRDSASLCSASWSYIEEGEELSEAKDEFTSLSTSCDTATAAALEACSVAQRGMARMNRGFNTIEKADKAVNQESVNKHEGVSTGELKQAIVSMMLKKDEIEEQNRNLDNLLIEQRKKSDQLQSEVDELRDLMKQQENRQSTQIGSLSRENELLKHQLKKYVGAVQALRSDLHGKSPEAMEVLSGIRQDEVLPPLPPEKNTEETRLSEEAEEYKRKLIQVADLHGELMEFNEHLHKQLGFYQYQVRRLREELIHLRGPLPEDSQNLDDVTNSSNSSNFDPAVMSVGSRPLVNVWIPSVFLRGRSSNVHHVYQVYVRIKDDEWNIYRRYSQFLELHKDLRRRYPIVDHFKFPPKKTLGNKDSQFVEERRRLLQDYLRRVINLYATSSQELSSTTTKLTLIQILPFFGDPYPPEKVQKELKPRRKRSAHYTGL